MMNSRIFAAASVGDYLPHVQANQTTLTAVLTALYSLIGALAVIFIIVGGIRYILAAGDSSKIAGAKNTILYAIAGLVIAVLAFAITNFVVARVDGSSFNSLRDSIIRTLLYIAGSLAIIFIVYGGFKYVTSNGDSSKVQSAKNTILYSVVGLLITIVAFAVVNFVISNI